MKVTHLRYLALALIFAGLALLGLAARKTVSLETSGTTFTLTTFASSVEDLLQVAGVPYTSGDLLSHPLNHRLRDGDTIRVQQATRFLVQADGETRLLMSQERLPANLLAQAEIPLFPGDLVLANGLAVAPGDPLPAAEAHSLQVQRAVRVTLQEGPQARVFYAAGATLGQALAQAGIILHATDRLTPSAETPLHSPGSAPIEVILQRSIPVSIKLADRQIQFRSAAGTVGEALSEAGVSLQGLDYSLPAPFQPLPPEGSIQVVRVQESIELEQEPLQFETQLEPAPDIELDTQEVIQPGEYGLLARRVRIRYEDGQEVSRQVDEEWQAKEPQPRIMGYGTKIVIRSLATPDGPIEYWRAVPMYATSYSPCRIFKDRCDSYTALGATLQKGIVAMTNYWCRTTCGDQVYVPGYGVGVVADTGGGIPGRYWIDLGYSDADYVSWHQTVMVYFLTPVPANLMWVLP